MLGCVKLLVVLFLSMKLSDSAHVRGGRTHSSGCSLGRVITPKEGKVGSIQSSVGGDLYAHNTRCSWEIRGGDTLAASVTLTFKSFDLEKRGKHTMACYGT